MKSIMILLITAIPFLAILSLNFISVGNAYSTIDRLTDPFVSCTSFETNFNPNENAIILRLDDVQAFASRRTTMRIVNAALEREIPMVLGVIPKGLDEDPRMVRYLSENICNVEIALHGWDHQTIGEYSEFELLTKEEALTRAKKGKDLLEGLFGINIITFIPPENKFMTQSLKKETSDLFSPIGLHYISGGASEKDATKEKYDFTIALLENHLEKAPLNSVEKTIESCKADLNKRGLCVILLHPQTFENNHTTSEWKMDEYYYLLDELEDLNTPIITFKDIAKTEGVENWFYSVNSIYSNFSSLGYGLKETICEEWNNGQLLERLENEYLSNVPYLQENVSQNPQLIALTYEAQAYLEQIC